MLPGGNDQFCVLCPKISLSKMVPVLVCRRVSLCYESFQGIQPHPPGLWFLQAWQAGVQSPGTQVPALSMQESPLACLLIMTSLSLVLELHRWLLPLSHVVKTRHWALMLVSYTSRPWTLHS